MNNIEAEPQSSPETETEAAESKPEQETNILQGAEMLENPPDGSFVHGLQLFVAWVQSLVAPDK